MFDITTTGNVVIISSLDLHLSLASDVTVEVRTRVGTYSGFERSPGQWKFSARYVVKGLGKSKLTPIPRDAFKPILIPANSRMGIYVTTTGLGGMILTNVNGNLANTLPIGDDNLRVTVGVSSKYMFSANNSGRFWNGAVNYALMQPL